MTRMCTHRICKDNFIWKPDPHFEGFKESTFDILLKSSWKDAEKKSIMSYDVKDVLTKVLPGQYNLVVQLNPMRVKKRRLPAFISSIKQPFDPEKFNFMKVKEEETLFEIVVNKDFTRLSTSSEEDVKATIIVNTAPITPYHSLIVPSREKLKSQVLDYEGLLLGVSLILASNTAALKVGYNSLGGMASVNHYHLHVYYLQHPLTIETADCENLVGPVDVFKDHFAPGFVFHLKDGHIEAPLRDSLTLINFLLDEEIGHNVMITRGVESRRKDGSNAYDTVCVCIWARKLTYGVKTVDGFAAALCELAGHVPVYDEETWQTIREDQVTKVLHDICLETYTSLLPKIKKLFSA